MGVGGIYLCIEHTAGAEADRLLLHAPLVVRRRRAEEVKAGETIGFVGRTGVKVSPPHLHFEVRVDDRFTNPVRTLGDTVIPPQATMTHQYVLRAKRAQAPPRLTRRPSDSARSDARVPNRVGYA